jgi:hypothetical protein
LSNGSPIGFVERFIYVGSVNQLPNFINQLFGAFLKEGLSLRRVQTHARKRHTRDTRDRCTQD